ncbi:MAG TPA: dephospho-CoA kinase [Firmicutes bacterium]|nr:dephospho-CoA kinase [Bacillota bacterium]
MTPNKIAVTGGLGSGKSEFCGILREMGYPVFSCDEINRELWKDPSYLSELAGLFPDCLTDGLPDKTKLSRKVFSDERARARLNALSQPRIMQELIGRMNRFPTTVFAEVPLLFEGGYEKLFDAVIALRRDKETRISAVSKRDGLTRTDALARIQRQFDPDKLEEKQCLIVENDGDRAALKQKAELILQAIRSE